MRTGNETLLTKKEAAERLHISVWQTEQLIKKGLLPVVPVGARVRIRPADVSAYIRDNLNYKGSVRTTESITKSVASRGVARPKDLLDAIHSESGEMRELRKAQEKAAKAAAKKAKKKRKKQAKLEAVRRLPTGSLPSSAVAKGVFGPILTKDGKTAFSADSPYDMRAELERQLAERDPALRLAAEKALKPSPPVQPEDTPAYWRKLAENPVTTAAERTQYLARAERLEIRNRPRSASSYAQ